MMSDLYYANYNGMTVEDYVEKTIRSNSHEMERTRKIVSLVADDVESLLDVGAGHGIFLEQLREGRGIAGVGIEITDAKIDYARKNGIDIRKGDAAALSFSDKSFDAVVTTEVIEHLPFGVYESALAEFVRVARKYILISVPYAERRQFAVCTYCGSSSPCSFHFRSFSEEDMRKLFHGAHCTLIEKTGPLGYRPWVTWLMDHRQSGNWPKYHVCPACGYKDELGGQSGRRILDENQTVRERGLKARIKTALKNYASPFLIDPTRPRWIIGLYVVNGNGEWANRQ